MAKYKIKLKDSEEIVYYGLFQRGGSIGQNANAEYRRYGDGILLDVYLDREQAKEDAKRYRKYLTPGERSYYGMGYTVKPLNKSDLKNEVVQRMIAEINTKVEDSAHDDNSIVEYEAVLYDEDEDIIDSQMFDYEEDAITFCKDNDYDEVIMYVYNDEVEYEDGQPNYSDTVWMKGE